MKNIILVFIIFIFSFAPVFAKNHEKDYTINFNGSKFHLLYSIKNKDFGGYLNEYYKKGETYNIWSELVAVHHFPNAYSPIDRIREFKDYLGNMHVPSSLTFDDKKNTAMIDFIMISDKKMPIVLEFNVFKYEKSKKCGSVAIQYAKRYSATTTMQIENIKRDFEKNRKHIISELKHFKIPELVTYDIDKCISAVEIIEENKQNELQEDSRSVCEMKEEFIEEKDITEETTETIMKEKDSETKLDDNEESVQAKINIIPEEVVTISEDEKDVSGTVTSNTKKDESENGTESEIISAPIPAAENGAVKLNRKTKKVKEISYVYCNDKSQYIAKPRTNKELKNEVKQNKKKQKEALKAIKTSYKITNDNSNLIAEPRTKKELRRQVKQRKKLAKERAKKASRALKY